MHFLLLRHETEVHRAQEQYALLFDDCCPSGDDLERGDHRYALVADDRGGVLVVLRQEMRSRTVTCAALVVARADVLPELIAYLRRFVDAVGVRLEASPGHGTRVHVLPGVTVGEVDATLVAAAARYRLRLSSA